MKTVQNRKNIFVVFLCILVFASITIFESCLSKNNYNESIETNATPIANKVIVLDARTWNSR